jgi:hypothetical protein
MADIGQAARPNNVPVRGRGRHLAEPLIVSRFWKNRAHDAIVTELATY